jgi:hypothetical protein
MARFERVIEVQHMPARHSTVRICPDCGGIMQPTEPERLTTSEVASADAAPERPLACQCLLCGYHDGAAREERAGAR